MDMEVNTIYLIENGQIIEAINALAVTAAKYPNENFAERLEMLRTEFQMLRDYFVRGVNDPKRGEIFRGIKGKLSNLDYDIQVCEQLREMPLVKAWMPYVKQMDSSVEALLEANAEYAFYEVMASYHWRNENIEDWVSHFTGDVKLTSQHYILIGALTLSTLQHFSKQKALCLARIYKGLSDKIQGDKVRGTRDKGQSTKGLGDEVQISMYEDMRQRAFVGCVLALSMDRDAVYNKKRDEVLKELLDSDEAVKALIELQIQLIKCTQADVDATKINETIMPEIIKNQPFIVTRNGIVEKDEENSDEDSEEKIEAMEQNIMKVQKMQKQGSDIFFGGFKQMKRYPFFNKVSNWFAPFDINHPDLTQVAEKLKGSKFLERVLEMGPFCNSDKYSFVFAMADVIGDFSDKMRELMEEGDLGPIGMHKDISEVQEPTYVRRQYLQDLFRFFSIHPLGKALNDPFKDAEDFEAWLISLSYVDTPHMMEMGKYMIKKKYLRALEDLINCYPNQDDAELDYLSGELLMNEGVYGEAVDYYNSYLQEHPNHQPSMRGMAKAYYSSGDYGKAAFYYDALRTLQPDRISYALNYCMAMVKDGRASEVLNELYRLNFENPDNHAVSNTLGWALLYAEKPDKALAVYEKIPEEVVTHDLSLYLNYVYAYFVTKFRLPDKKFVSADGTPSCQTLLEEMRADAPMLGIYGIGNAEITIMAHSL